MLNFLTPFSLFDIIMRWVKIEYAAVAQLVERRIGNAEVSGSNPVSSSLSIDSKNIESF